MKIIFCYITKVSQKKETKKKRKEEENIRKGKEIWQMIEIPDELLRKRRSVSR